MLRFEEPLLITDTFSAMCLPLDSAYFGFSCAKLVLKGQIDETDLATAFSAIDGYKFTTFTNINNDMHNNQLLQKHGGLLQTDINIQLKRPAVPGKPVNREDIKVQNNCVADEALLQIADQAFLHSRFLNDPVMPRIKATGFYRWWLSLSFGREDKYIITVGDPTPKGFLLFKYTGDTVVMELIGMLPGFAGKGAGTAMISVMSQFALDHGYRLLQTGTQLENINALGFYQRNGFGIVGSSNIYHYWQ